MASQGLHEAGQDEFLMLLLVLCVYYNFREA